MGTRTQVADTSENTHWCGFWRSPLLHQDLAPPDSLLAPVLARLSPDQQSRNSASPQHTGCLKQEPAAAYKHPSTGRGTTTLHPPVGRHQSPMGSLHKPLRLASSTRGQTPTAILQPEERRPQTNTKLDKRIWHRNSSR